MRTNQLRVMGTLVFVLAFVAGCGRHGSNQTMPPGFQSAVQSGAAKARHALTLQASNGDYCYGSDCYKYPLIGSVQAINYPNSIWAGVFTATGGAGGDPISGGQATPTPDPLGCGNLAGGATGGDSPNAFRNGVSLNAIIADNGALSDLVIYNANNGFNPPTVVINNNAEPAADATNVVGATVFYDPANPASDTLTWNTGGVEWLVDHQSASETQILYEELDHFYYSLGDMSNSNNFPASQSVTIDGVTYTWNLNDYSAGGGYQSYQHLLIHDDLVDKFGSDHTSSLREAIQGSDHSANASTVVANHSADHFHGTYQPAGPPANQNCRQNAHRGLQSLTAPSGIIPAQTATESSN